MKVRFGFVSNSSSSSFMVISDSNLTEEMLKEALGIIPGTPSEFFLKDMVDCLIGANTINFHDYLRNYCANSIKELIGDYGEGSTVVEVAKELQGGKSVRSYHCSSDDGIGWECMIYYGDDFDFKSKDGKIRLIKEY